MSFHSTQEKTTSQQTHEFAQVLLDIDAKALDKRTFTYRIPELFAQEVKVGVSVRVSFGRMPEVLGFVVGFIEKYTEPYPLKEIIEVLDETPLFDLAYLQFLDWASNYYATPLTQVISCALPSGLLQKPRKEISLTKPLEPHTLLFQPTPLSPKEQELLLYLNQKPEKGFTPQYLAKQLNFSSKLLHQQIARLKQLRLIQVHSNLKDACKVKTVKQVTLQPGYEDLMDEHPDLPSAHPNLSARQRQIVLYLLKREGTALLKEVLESVETTLPTLKKMESEGILSMSEIVLNRDPVAYYASLAHKQKYPLSDAQHAAVEAVLNSSSYHPFLLYGVTGSGKTEVYLTLTEKTLRAGKSVLMMVPEIALTSQISKRFIERFGVENIALWHSNLSVGEKTDTWRRIARGDLRIAIGARSSVFTPLVNLGMIMIDEEHDGSFKQDSPAPRYNAKVLAQELAKRTSAKIVYGSATPDPVSFEEAIREGQLLILPERFGGRPMARVELVDMKRERSAGNKTTLSRLLQEELVLNLERKEQTIILINRRGFFTLVTCTQCDYTFMCPQCSVALTVHKSKNLVRCHYCGFEESIPIFCPKCASDQLTQAGTGSQRVEQELLSLLPEAKILRLDSDVMQRKETYREVFEAFSAGEADILVGTQMIAKGLDIPNVTLVGVISADSSFYLPDFKSSERGFQLLTQVAGRAGRGEKPGRVVVQSVDPNHAVIQFAKVQDYDGFYHYEMTSRKELNFPPFSQLFRFIVSAEEEYKASHFIKAMAMNLIAGLEKEGLDPTSIELLGPAPCVIGRIQGRFRFHCLLKNLSGEVGHRFITQFYKSITPPEAINFLLDVEPQSLL